MNELAFSFVSTRDKVFIAEEYMKQLPQREIETIHHFSKGVYAREIHIPADTYVIGEIHKFENLNILSKGKISVLTENGMEVICAPATIVSPPGTKRAAYAHTECVWTTIHGTDLKDVNEIKSVFIAGNEKEWLEFSGANQLELKLC